MAPEPSPAPARGRYNGRFAPTPSGPLHMGSLLTAVLSWLDARAHDGVWRLRIDDLDGARCDRAHTDTILRQLETHGLHWDGPIHYQSAHRADYESALATLHAEGHVYGCACSRREVQQGARRTAYGMVYSGRCRNRGLTEAEGRTLAWRMRAPEGPACFLDEWQGVQSCDWQQDIGDFVVRRRDGIAGYALCSAVDEARMGITHIVRGSDLLDATQMHLAVLAALRYPAPRLRHGPIIVRAGGAKLSKQNHAPPINGTQAASNLHRCLRWLGMPQHAATGDDAPQRILAEAAAAWRASRQGPLPRRLTEAAAAMANSGTYSPLPDTPL